MRASSITTGSPTPSTSPTCRLRSTIIPTGSSPRLEARLADVAAPRQIFLGYADCGTGGELDAFIERSERRSHGFPGRTATSSSPAPNGSRTLHEEELGTFYLTDFLAKHFDG